jgi:hypothetical protein
MSQFTLNGFVREKATSVPRGDQSLGKSTAPSFGTIGSAWPPTSVAIQNTAGVPPRTGREKARRVPSGAQTGAWLTSSNVTR